MPSRAGPSLTLLGATALPYCLFWREGDVSEQDHFLGTDISSKRTQGPKICICLLCVCSPCLHLSPAVVCISFCCRFFGNQGQDISIWAKTECTPVELWLCVTELGAQKQIVFEAEPQSSTVFRRLICLCSQLRHVLAQAHVSLWH